MEPRSGACVCGTCSNVVMAGLEWRLTWWLLPPQHNTINESDCHHCSRPVHCRIHFQNKNQYQKHYNRVLEKKMLCLFKTQIFLARKVLFAPMWMCALQLNERQNFCICIWPTKKQRECQKSIAFHWRRIYLIFLSIAEMGLQEPRLNYSIFIWMAH